MNNQSYTISSPIPLKTTDKRIDNNHNFTTKLNPYSLSNSPIKSDEDWMRLALSLAYYANGQTGSNPSVGAVIVKNNKLVGMGAHLKQGTAHAEIHALNMAGDNARGATIYVTLEPCCHTGLTGPCTEALIAAGITKVVVALVDKNPNVEGKGILSLKEAGIEVVVGICHHVAQSIHHEFFVSQITKRSYVILKTACSLDGKLALDNLESQWITNEQARIDVHHLRASVDAILTGIGTVKVDNPMLNVRLDGNQKQPARIVIDRQGEIEIETKIVQTAHQFRTILLGQYSAEKKAKLINLGCEVEPYDSLKTIFSWTLKQGLMRVLIEAGPRLVTALLDDDLVDEWVLYQSPRVFGGNQSIYQNIKPSPLDEIKRFEIVNTELIGQDIKILMRQNRKGVTEDNTCLQD
ncbi:bifunctional diaminohydroxyphosphoribosylaminopyrimidine deaminase/5-amino-6-(5-phosphoribosylamino)uracil reductase RibD [Thorsellia anophelis]|uniref:Riboflavin biosynthesis protein RibD n=1 Tax=Thorsellia anophelis DSM 18579 TaxID=1123402 RepID=A0A1I0CJ61_9GAMM|nr:bifunctional diaminohydroxyphosphoribosylaminopyrimidine deaminase/5-amino-6-(5-phosphoribosylamino)uracil reductase RibD [Thorsellia anophelis]SET19657.1 diaminohydroxyphosphoribosylaminopyrimidine deaminase [Thorsellia anophelis DSM 18579]